MPNTAMYWSASKCVIVVHNQLCAAFCTARSIYSIPLAVSHSLALFHLILCFNAIELK